MRGKTLEQEATLCLVLLMGYSVSVYANLDDEVKKKAVLKRARSIVKENLSTSLKRQLLIICDSL